MMMGQKRRPVSVEHRSVRSFTSKRLKPDMLLVSSKEKKDKFGKCIAALQHLVSPYGKTDTASVLYEVVGYINFLHQQVKVLSTPYLCTASTSRTNESEGCSFRNKGLCVVPISYTIGVASKSSNGADIWAPVNTCPKSQIHI